MRNYLICILLLFLLITSCNSNKNGSGKSNKFPKISPEQVKAELDSILINLEESHPDPYTQITQKDLLKKIDKLKSEIKDSLNIIDYYLKATPVLSAVNDGHTGLMPPFKLIRKINPPVFPIHIILNNAGKIISQKRDKQIPQYAEIVSINNIETNQIIQELSALISAEEYNYKKYHLNRNINILMGAYFNFPEQYKITYNYEGKEKSVELNGKSAADLSKRNRKSKKKIKNYTFETLENNTTGYINFKSFSGLQKFEEFLDSSFRIIKEKKIQNLIIDLRENGGGNSMLGDALFQYISKAPFHQFGKTIVKYSRQRENFYKANRSTWFSDMPDSTFNRLFLHKAGELVIEDGSELIQLKKNPLRYNGQIYLLTSIRTFSSAANFAWTFKKFKMGAVIGGKTGGHIVSFGDMLLITLPYSKLSMYVSHKEFYGYGAADNERHCVYPDYTVNKEEALNYTLKLIKEKK